MINLEPNFAPDGARPATCGWQAQGDPATGHIADISRQNLPFETKGQTADADRLHDLPASKPAPVVSSGAGIISQPETLDLDRQKEENRRRAIVDQFNQLLALGYSKAQAAHEMGVPEVTLWRYRQPGGIQDKRHLNGRKPFYLPTAGELACVKEIYSKIDESEARGRGLGSSRITAYRIAAKGDDQRITEAFKSVVLKNRRSKTVPPSWLRLLDTSIAVIDYGRDKRSTMSAHVSTPRNKTYVTEDLEELAMRAGVALTADDGTLNFYATIPWPFGGDPCSEKFGVKLGRWQFLPAVDVHSEMCPLWDVVAREKSSYRGEDAAALIGRAMIEEFIPEWWLLERGSWESKRVRELLEMVNVHCINAWHSKQKNAVERFFDRAWTPASLIRGHVGRDRGRYHHVEQLAQACQQGRRDPRDHFDTFEQIMPQLAKVVEFANTEPIVSKSGWGTWVPQERYTTQLAETPRVKLDPAQSVFFSREQRVWTVRKCTLGGSVEGPLLRFPTYFQCEEMAMFEGCKVKCYFDPYVEQVQGTLVLQDEWRGFRPGHIIARDVPALELPPQAILAEDGWNNDEQARSLAVRKAISKAVRTEYCNWRGIRKSEAIDGMGNKAVRTGAAAPATVQRVGGLLPAPRQVEPMAPELAAQRRRNRAEDAAIARELTEFSET